jgi:UDP-N-acetylglucosamine--N-acetylmuramyl-(pentapeptide) pyrophosphoryl-undecaprenol N-acetylglucosamine transferase
LKNLAVPFKLLKSLRIAKQIINEFKPDAVIGVGGYASAAVLYVASKKGIPTLIQEQNSLPGITNKFLSKKVNRICVAYSGLEKYFPANKIVFTGNPVRQDITQNSISKSEVIQKWNVPANKTVVLVIGGSLGARSINNTIAKHLADFEKNETVLIWQTGKSNYTHAVDAAKGFESHVIVKEFIREMDWAYSLADVVISRAGALAVSELCLVAKPCILVPYPHASEDHQTVNARSLEAQKAAWVIADQNLDMELMPKLKQLIENKNVREEMSTNLKKLAKPNASSDIVKQILSIAKP